MYCQKCGKEIDDEAIVCTNCGCAVKNINLNQTTQPAQDYSTSKAGMGVLFALLLGLIGLVIGICIYPENTVARQTFIKGWGITFGVSVGVLIILFMLIFSVFGLAFIPYY